MLEITYYMILSPILQCFTKEFLIILCPNNKIISQKISILCSLCSHKIYFKNSPRIKNIFQTEIVLNEVSLGRSPIANFALILQKSHYSIPLVSTHVNLQPIFYSCCVNTQTNIFKKSQYFLLPKTLNILFLLCPHTLAPLCWGSGRSLPATHSLHLEIFSHFYLFFSCSPQNLSRFFIWFFSMFFFCHSHAAPQNLSPVFIWFFFMVIFCHSLAAPQN